MRLIGFAVGVFVKFLDDLLVLGGCVLIVIGTWYVCPVATWFVAGIMLIGLGVLVGLVGKRGMDAHS